MSNSRKRRHHDKTFADALAPSDKTDATLVIGSKKLHVNKALLSYHSDYFNTIFNADFAEKSMREIPIKDVKYENFATLLSLVHDKPITPTESNAEKLLQLADRFLIPAARNHVENFLCSSQMDKIKKLKLAEKYNLDVLFEKTIESYEKKEDFHDISFLTRNSSDRVKAKLFDRYFCLFHHEQTIVHDDLSDLFPHGQSTLSLAWHSLINDFA